MHVGAVVGALLVTFACQLGGASAASAQFVTDVSHCGSPPIGDTWYADWESNPGGTTGTFDPQSCIDYSEYQKLENEVVAAGDEATGAQLPTDLPAADEQIGTQAWDGLHSAAGDLKDNAFQALSTEGDWAPLDAIGTAIPLAEFAAAGTAAIVGWQIGTEIANVTGISGGNDPNPVAGSYVIDKVTPVLRGHTEWGAVIPSDAWMVHWDGGSGFPTGLDSSTDTDGDYCPNWGIGASLDGMAIAKSPQVSCQYDISDSTPEPGSQTWTSVYYVPMHVTALPGPGQGGTSTGTQHNFAGNVTGADSGWWNGPPSEAGQLTGAGNVLTQPATSPFAAYVCTQPGNEFCSHVATDPQPGQIKIPAPKTDETYAQYLADLQAAGLVGTITQSTLSDAQADPSVAPGDVVRSSPASGTWVDPSAAISVYVNPDSSPTSPPGGGPPGAPTLPGVSVPTATTPCSVFPFGIPCWISNQLGQLASTSPLAPSFAIPLPDIACGHNCSLGVNLDHPFGVDLSAMMSIIRVVLLFLSFLGLVLWLGGMAMGGSTGGGGTESSDGEG